MFRYNTYHPSADLRPFISHYRFLRIDVQDEGINRIQDYPRTAMDMIFLFEGNMQIGVGEQRFELHPSCFIGQFDKGYDIRPQNRVELLNIRFRPNGIYPLTKLPLKETFNNHVALEELFSKRTNVQNLHEQLALLPDDAAKIALLEAFLRQLYQASALHYRLDYGIQHIQEQQGCVRVQDLCKQLSTNYKSLNRWFEKRVGLSPKRFIQLTRFKHLLEDIEQQAQPDWMELVVQYDFHDQAHFVKEFKQFAGKTPTAYLGAPALLR